MRPDPSPAGTHTPRVRRTALVSADRKRWPAVGDSRRSPALGKRRCPCGQGKARTRAPGRRPHRRPCRCRGRSPVVVAPGRRRSRPPRRGTEPPARRGASPSAVCGTPIAEEQVGWVVPLGQLECLGRSLPGHSVQCEAPGGGCRGDDRHDDCGSSGKGDDDDQVQSGGGGHGRGCGGGKQSSGGGDGNRSRGRSDGILSAGVVRTWGGDESPSGGNERRRMQSLAGGCEERRNLPFKMATSAVLGPHEDLDLRRHVLASAATSSGVIRQPARLCPIAKFRRRKERRGSAASTKVERYVPAGRTRTSNSCS